MDSGEPREVFSNQNIKIERRIAYLLIRNKKTKEKRTTTDQTGG